VFSEAQAQTRGMELAKMLWLKSANSEVGRSGRAAQGYLIIPWERGILWIPTRPVWTRDGAPR
jgi:hypothetical protein